jgi:hypothetical protein
VWNGKAIRDGSWKLMVDGKGGDDIGLYDLSRDVGEQNNLADVEPDRVKTMLAQLEAWRTDVASGDSVQPALTAEQQASKANASAPKKKTKKK